MNKWRSFVAGIIGCLSAEISLAEPIKELTVYTAKQIVTMEPSQPYATAVAVANGKIVSVGSLQSLKPWTDKYPTTVDTTFKDKVLMPGFIDPHVHPSLPAILTAFPFIAPEEWKLPSASYEAATTQDAYIRLLKEHVKQFVDQNEGESKLFVTWGFHQLWHGDIGKSELDALFKDQPIVLWHRSFHELVLNSAAIKLLNIQEADIKPYAHDIDWQKGLFSEYGAKAVLVPRLMPFILTPESYMQGMKDFARMAHIGGVTSIMDMGVGVFGDAEGEIKLIKAAMQDAPARIVLTPIVTDFITRKLTPEQALKQVREWESDSTNNVSLDGHFKLMMDGAAFSGLGQMGFPGYIDGHEGIWMSPLEVTHSYAEAFWKAGYQLHAHANGDMSTQALIEMVEQLQVTLPRTDHRTTLEHYMYATEDQAKQMASLGMAVSANPYYQFILSDIYAERWLGEDRARNMSPLKSVVNAGVRLGLHSDAPMAPLSPLLLVDTAVNRITINGNQNAKSQRLSVYEALKGITIDAAWLMRMEDSIGSIRAGKKADFTVLEKNPLKVSTKKIKDIKVWGVVFEGEKFKANNSD